MKQKKLDEITEKNLTTLRAFVNAISSSFQKYYLKCLICIFCETIIMFIAFF